MEIFDDTLLSHDLDEDLDVIVYGKAGVPVIVFPTFDFCAGSWENNGMIDALADLIDGGKIQVFCTDSVDGESWYARNSKLDYRSERQEAFTRYVTGQLLDYVRKHAGSEAKPILAGCGVGALNASCALLREPAKFGGLLAMSGAFDARFFSYGETDERWLANSPLDLVECLTAGMKKVLDAVPMAFVCGQGQDEEGVQTMRQLDAAYARAGLHASFEYWGYDVAHEWGWWQKMAAQFLPALLRPAGLAQRRYVYVKEHADQVAGHLAEVEQEAQAKAKAERKASARVKREEKAVSEKTEAAEKAAAAARAAWDRRNELAAKLAELDRAANEAQRAADQAAKERSDAEWYAGEARNALDVARAERAAAKALLNAAKRDADEAEAQRQAFENSVHELEAEAKKTQGAVDAGK